MLPSELITKTRQFQDYQVADITQIVKAILISRADDRNEGFVMLNGTENDGYELLATGDNYFTPQII